MRLRCITWNLAAINNNPFEYWITHHDAAYNELMSKAAQYIKNDKGVPVSTVFTDEMFAELKTHLLQKYDAPAVEATEKIWREDYSSRLTIESFLKDKELGAKRLTSMPDRVTNTIVASDTACRPTVINCYEGGDLSSMDAWWDQWKTFMFEEPHKAADRLVPINKSKYPAITEHEAGISLPLQALCLAIFDAVMVDMMHRIAPATWQNLRAEIANALNKRKWPRTTEILTDSYADADVMFLQEVSAAYISDLASSPFGASHHIVSPAKLGKRDQNSVILARREVFPNAPVEVALGEEIKGVGAGDLLVAQTKLGDEDVYLASFHGDTNGLLSIPVVEAVARFVHGKTTIFGLDANTHALHVEGKKQGVDEFVAACANLKLGCIQDGITTYNARTFLQPQLHKACTREEFLKKGDVNPKDAILYCGLASSHADVAKDNSGDMSYEGDTPLPSMTFPSDHAILRAIVNVTL